MQRITSIVILLLGWMTGLRAQDTLIFNSALIPRPDTVLVFKPAGYNPQQRYPLAYLLHGYSENYRQWSRTTDLQKLSDTYGFIIVCPDGFVHWYVNSGVDAHARFTDFFFQELAPRVGRQYRVDERNIFITGLSMGGHGALLTFLQRPDYFKSAGSTSGAVLMQAPVLDYAAHVFGLPQVVPDIRRVMGLENAGSRAWEAYSVYHLIDRLKGMNKPFIFDCGTEDPLYASNNAFKQKLDALGIPATYISQPGGHDTPYWSRSIWQHFAFFSRLL